MKVGIIVYSQTGNTMSVAEKLEKSIKALGHPVEILKVEVENQNTPSKLKTAPDVSPFDVLVFASFVQAFTLTPAMKSYLSQISSLTNKKVYCFITQHLKKTWLGGNRALRQIHGVCKKKGGEVLWSGLVNWSGDRKNEQIDAIVAGISSRI
jgi:flavodoxin